MAEFYSRQQPDNIRLLQWWIIASAFSNQEVWGLNPSVGTSIKD
jgi:hypothetical protein